MGVGCYSSEAAGWASKRATVNLRSKGPARKGNPPLRDIDLSPNKIFFSYSNIGYKRISIYVEDDLTLVYNKENSMQIFDLFSDLHQARMRGRGKGNWGREGRMKKG